MTLTSIKHARTVSVPQLVSQSACVIIILNCDRKRFYDTCPRMPAVVAALNSFSIDHNEKASTDMLWLKQLLVCCSCCQDTFGRSNRLNATVVYNCSRINAINCNFNYRNSPVYSPWQNEVLGLQLLLLKFSSSYPLAEWSAGAATATIIIHSPWQINCLNSNFN